MRTKTPLRAGLPLHGLKRENTRIGSNNKAMLLVPRTLTVTAFTNPPRAVRSRSADLSFETVGAARLWTVDAVGGPLADDDIPTNRERWPRADDPMIGICRCSSLGHGEAVQAVLLNSRLSSAPDSARLVNRDHRFRSKMMSRSS
jgi:hypothetical protein